MYTQYHGEVQLDPVTNTNKHVDQIMREYYPNFNYNGVFFDVGAFEPIRISNSYHFEKNGWDCYCFEANTHGIPLLKEHRKNVFNYAVADQNKDSITFDIVESAPGWTAGYSAIEISWDYKQKFGWNDNYAIHKVTVPQKTLNTIIETEIPQLQTIDIMSIDIEGGELNCLKGFDLTKYDPKLIVAENATPEKKELQEYLESFGYKLDRSVSYNQFYVSKNYKQSEYL
jgi:FkbM family methyltransferase